MLLSVVTLNYKTPQITLQCIQHLYATYQKVFEAGNIEHIIVDNGSDDGSAVLLQKEIKKMKYHHVNVVANKTNLGFAAGCNSGVKQAKGDYVLFLNSDVEVKDTHLLDMVGFLQQQEHVAIVGAQLVYPNGKKQLSAWKFYTLLNTFLWLLGLERLGLLQEKATQTTRVDWVSGACMMVRHDVFDAIGKFDEHIFMYVEDMELCYRARLKGWFTYYFPECKVVHSGRGSSNRSFAIAHIYQNLLYFYAKHRPRREYAIVKLLLQTKAFLLILYGKALKKPYFVSTYEKAFAMVG